MTLKQINKEIDKKEILIFKLSKDLHRLQTTEIEMELNKQKEILFYLNQIEHLLTY
jgi:hypothetical protein